jgi:hypothetical protein
MSGESNIGFVNSHSETMCTNKKGVFIGTSVPPPKSSQINSSFPMPSQFLDEMMTDETRDILGRFHKYHPEDNPSYDNLGEALVYHRCHKKLVNDIISIYLPKKKIILSPEIITRIKNNTEKTEEHPLMPPVYSPDSKKRPKWWD